jgi:hypothetical protein
MILSFLPDSAVTATLMPFMGAISFALAPRGAEAFGSRLAAWASNLPDGAVALLVGHSPIIELATFHVTQRAAIVSGLPELGWVDIEIANDGQYRVVNATVQVKIGDATIMPQPR